MFILVQLQLIIIAPTLEFPISHVADGMENGATASLS